ncbi:hypothetical protein SNE40_011889 [Patella caerulea]|uniref:RB1-inducible coiled-coil protein 1 n=1 Tax=Patella caerulea TaxID=87958 RepID=A0AAN8JMT9_PATCE
MLYIFLVDTGTMMTFDMNLAMESVSKLQTVICKACHISEDKQVLLISGGESLDPHARVGRYSAGTDTNPIYLFSKSTIEAATPPSPSIHYGSDVDLQSQVEGSLIMPPAYETVVSRTQLAVQFRDVDEDELRACMNLVHDQHLQQQGWAAVVANLEDITIALQQRSNIFQAAYSEYLEKRDQYVETLSQIGESLHLQTKIPLLSCLPTNQDGNQQITVLETSSKADSEEVDSLPTCSTLFQWINSQDPHHSLQDMVDRCIKAAEQFDESVADTLSKEVSGATEAVSNASMKEVKGLEDRLYGLDQIMSGARKIVEEQSDMAKGFVQNQSRVTNLRDKSILPDLCASHKKQLVAMLNNHKKLRDIKKKCRMAKEELAVNLHTRLRWVMFVEKKICDVDGKLTIYHESLRRLHKQLDIMRQIEEAPKVYAQLVVEVVRRRMFSLQFMEWANNLAEETKHLHTEEVKRRQSFQHEIGKHFLQSLFQGFEDLPPPYASEAPTEFDQNLPVITAQDVEMLRDAVPELQDIFKVPNDIPVSQRMSFQTVGTSVSFHKETDQLFPGSTNTSDIDILHASGEHLFVHIDSSKMSLGEQVKTCEPSEIIISPQTVSTVEKPDFPIPQSLSETLTQEMSSQVKGESVKGEVMIPSPKKQTDSSELIGSSASGDIDTRRSIESDTQISDKSVGKCAVRKGHNVKGHALSDTSPEIETSQEFSTADYYFDESMPSSMIDSPPNKSATSEKAHSSSGSVRREIIMGLEKELGLRQQNITNLELKLKSMNLVFKKDLPCLKEDFLKLKDLVKVEHKTFGDNFLQIQKQMSDVLEKYSKHVDQSYLELTKTMKQEHLAETQELKTIIATEQETIEKLKEDMDAMKKVIEEQKVSLTNLESKSSTELNEMRSQNKKTIEELQQKHLLELELELDKLRVDLNDELVQHETMVQNLQEKLKQSEEKVETSVREKETTVEDLNRKFQIEKEEITKILEENFTKQKESEIEKLKGELLDEQNTKIKQSEKETSQIFSEKIETLKKEFFEEKETDITNLTQELNDKHEDNILEITEKLTKEKEAALNELRESLDKIQSDKILKIQQGFAVEKEKLEEKAKQDIKQTQDEEQQTEELKQDTAEELRLLEDKLETDYKQKLEKALKDEKDRHTIEIYNLQMQYEKDREDSLNSFKRSMVAEKQVQFNEAVEKVSREKDKTIEELHQLVERMKIEIESQKSSLEKIDQKDQEEDLEEIWNQRLQQKEKEFSAMKHNLEDELALSRQQVAQYQQQLMGTSEMSSTHTEEGATCSESVYKLPVGDLEKNLKLKDMEISKLQEKIMEMSMTASTRVVAQDKVSITSCKIGDLVLLCLDEPHDQYIVFTVRTTLHFLHSDCLEILGLKTAAGEPRKSWILAEITDKEYCQAKKSQNRFKVPVGTKFYRVKAKPWIRDAASANQPSTSSK